MGDVYELGGWLYTEVVRQSYDATVTRACLLGHTYTVFRRTGSHQV